uniref:RxLR effector candidate protein n=1 Tax=Hyaloperonospora arabidopsidis (strain Emoy2) TaxID=559515 RepID=M4B312_HYAAE
MVWLRARRVKLLVTVRKLNAKLLNRTYLCVSVNNAVRCTLHVLHSPLSIRDNFAPNFTAQTASVLLEGEAGLSIIICSSGKSKHLFVRLLHSDILHRLTTSISMRGTVNASQSVGVRLRAAATETSVSEAAGDHSSAFGLYQTAMFNGEGSCGALPRDDDDSEAEVRYSGESDDESDLKSLAKTFESAKAAVASTDGSSMTTRKVKHSNVSLVDAFSNSDWWSDTEDISRTSDCSPSRKRAEHGDSGTSDRTGKENDEFARRHCQYDLNESSERSAVTISGKIQGEPALLPEIKHWMPPQHMIARWTGLVFIDVFFKHRWFSGHRNQNGDALVQGWTAFITNVELMGLSKWLAKLEANRIKFETRTSVGGRYRLHRLSKAANLPCLSW